MATLTTLVDGDVATVAPVNANFSALNTEVRAVAVGGTGVGTLTDHGVLVGAGTGAITPLAVAATGTVLAGVTSADPAFVNADVVAWAHV